MEIKQLINESISEVDFESIVKSQVKSKMETAVKDAVDSAFRWGDFKKSLDKKIENELGFNLDKIKIQEYKSFIISEVNNALAGLLNEKNAKKIKELIYTDAIGESRKEIAFEDFIDELDEKIKDRFDDPCNCDGEELFLFAEIDSDRIYSTNNWNIGIRRKKKRLFRSHENDLEIITAAYFSSDGTIYHVRKCDDYDYSDISSWFIALKFLGTKITDFREEEISYPYDD